MSSGIPSDDELADLGLTGPQYAEGVVGAWLHGSSAEDRAEYSEALSNGPESAAQFLAEHGVDTEIAETFVDSSKMFRTHD